MPKRPVNSMQNIYPISAEKYPWHAQVLECLNAILNEYVVIGAAARDFLIYDIYEVDVISRASKDFDFAVLTDSWNDYDKMKGRLIRECGFSQGKAYHRLVYQELSQDE
jgi:predicted nucleotidyltransferase